VRVQNQLVAQIRTRAMSNGFLIVNKTSGPTSHDVVAMARKKLNTKKIGHAGTLDPLATGVLVLGVGIGTKLLNFIVEGRKSYEATIRLGSSTSTDDSQGELIKKFDTSAVTDTAIKTALDKFRGKIMQRPSSVSAIKIQGKSAHERVRDGETVNIPERPIEIYDLKILSISHNEDSIDINIVVACSSGTYIRSIARDLGEELKVGGHLIKLNRTEVAPFSISESQPLEEAKLITIAEGISRILPSRYLTPTEEREIFFGRPLKKSEFEVTAAFGQDGEFAALLTNKEQDGNILSFPSLVNVKE
jgi:tRNA pseudouridine55 synthase